MAATCINLIYYGPPGTGKTYKLQELLKQNYTDRNNIPDKHIWLNEKLEALSWYEIIILVLLDTNSYMKVADITSHEYYKIKAKLNERHTNLRATAWSALQSHTVQGSATVNSSSRREPFVFNKTENSQWYIEESQIDQLEEYKDLLEKLKSDLNIHSWAYFLVLVFIAASLPLSKYTMSMGQLMLLMLWLLSGFSFRISSRFFKIGGFFKGFYYLFAYIIKLAGNNFVEKFGQFFRNKAAVVLASIYLLHIIGLFHTDDMDYAMKDLRIKLPLLLFPVVISTMEVLKYRQFRILMLIYTTAVIVGTLISFNLILQAEFTDIRYTSPYISPIRFGLNVVFAFYALVYFILFDNYFSRWQKIGLALVAAWFVIFLFLMESVTAITILVLIAVLILIWQAIRQKYTLVRITAIVLAIGIPLGLFIFIRNTVISATTAPPILAEQLDLETASGNYYYHDTINRGVEDGEYVGLYICEEELEEEWSKRSNIDYHSYPEDSHELKETLIRYLTSKNLRKDTEGVEALTDYDIHMIEQGVANYNYVKNPGLRTRILKMLMGYEVYTKTGDPSGSSVMQRIEYSKASFGLVKDYFWFGVGTGDIENKLVEKYERMDSELKSRFQFHAHNQFVAIFITFGIFGLIWFLIALLYPPMITGRFTDYFFTVFFLIIMWSMLSDDTLETQAGVTLFAFFYSLLLFGKEKKEEINGR